MRDSVFHWREISGYESSDIEVRSIVADMMALERHGSMLRGDGKVAWFITGGTLGNVDEPLFFESVASQAKDGDWLVVGAHMVDDREGFLEDLEEEYRQEEVQKLVKMPLKGVLAELDVRIRPGWRWMCRSGRCRKR